MSFACGWVCRAMLLGLLLEVGAGGRGRLLRMKGKMGARWWYRLLLVPSGVGIVGWSLLPCFLLQLIMRRLRPEMVGMRHLHRLSQFSYSKQSPVRHLLPRSRWLWQHEQITLSHKLPL